MRAKLAPTYAFPTALVGWLTTKRCAAPAAGLAVAAGLLLALPSSAAAATRPYDSQITGLAEGQGSIAIDSDDDVFIDESGEIAKFNPYPSQASLPSPETAAIFGLVTSSDSLSLATDHATGQLFAANDDPREVAIFNGDGALENAWTGIDGIKPNKPAYLAIDNSSTYSKGRVYLALPTPENDIEVFDAQRRPVDFPATAGYIEANKLTGTPGAKFGQIAAIAVDPDNGNLYVLDAAKEAVDVFDPSGEFIRSFTGAGASQGFSESLNGIAVDPTNGTVLVVDGHNRVVDEFDSSGNYLGQIDGSGTPAGHLGSPNTDGASINGGIAVNSQGYAYVGDTQGKVDIFRPAPTVPRVAYDRISNPTTTSGTLGAEVDPEGSPLTDCHFEYLRPTPFVNEVQTLTLSGATGGSFSLGFEGQATGATGTGNLSAAAGTGNLSASSNEVTGLTTFAGEFAVGEEISGAGIPADTRINAVGAGSLTLSNSATTSGSGVALAAALNDVTGLTTSTGNFFPGEEISGAGIPAGTLITSVESNRLFLSALPNANASATPLTANLPFNSSAQLVGSALQALSTIGAGNVEVTGSAGGPYTVEFRGSLAQTETPQLTADATSLSPPDAAATPNTITQGYGWSSAASTSCLPAVGTIPADQEFHPVQAEITGLTTETPYLYRVVVGDANGVTYGADQTYTPHQVLGLSTEAASDLTESEATLNGSLFGNGEPTTYTFEWGLTPAYGHSTTPASVTPAASTGEALSFQLGGLSPYTTYHYRIVATNGAGTSQGEDRVFTTPPGIPSVKVSVSAVHSDRAELEGQINPNGGDTTYHFEYVDSADFAESGWAAASTVSGPEPGVGMSKEYRTVSALAKGLEPGTVYHYRLLAANGTGTASPERTFTTFPFTSEINDPCPNAHVRQQTGTALLLDCRAYELVSAADSDGYDVESDLVPGQTPFADYPEAEGPSRVLYGIHDGALATGDPTNHGLDPYLATRGADGWKTQYVGIPASGTPSAAPFGSPLLAADAGLDAFAFGGPGLCSPCFAGPGVETGIPLRLPDGELVQGMTGPLEPEPIATPDGYIAEPLSPDGTHFLFGSTFQFESSGNNKNGNVSIYDRDLQTGETHAVSKSPTGAKLTCLQGTGNCHSPGDPNGIAELAVSKDGSRVLLAQKVSEDADGNVYWHLYMNIGDSSRTIDLTRGVIATPSGSGFTEGVLFDGMTADGSRVFFTTKDKLLPQDENESADLYEAEVSESGATLHLISPGDAASCDPVADANGPHWNTVGPEESCGVLAIGGAGGVASEGGSVYFLSPEQLEPGHGTENQPNLYLAVPGSAPRFVATLEPDSPLVLDALDEAEARHTADFQLTPSGQFAAFASALPLTGYPDAGHLEVFRYASSSGPAGKLECVSCNPTGEPPTGEASLPSNGLALTDDGRVFFNDTEALVDRDNNEKEDVYEWEASGLGPQAAVCQTPGGCLDLISTGASPIASSLLGVSANGTDVYFFTRDRLVAQDENGNTVKIYDARELGGFPYSPPEPLCKSSDECHGPGSQAPPPPNIKSTAGAPPNAPQVGCKPGFVEKRGACVRKLKPHKPSRHRRRRHRRAHRNRGAGK